MSAAATAAASPSFPFSSLWWLPARERVVVLARARFVSTDPSVHPPPCNTAACYSFDSHSNKYVPFGKEWIKKQVFEQLKKQAGGT